jgi:hypothetical protein
MQDKLRAAFAVKEKAESFLTNLENLREEKSVGDAQYRVLKIEYVQMREDAVARVNTIKSYAKKELDDKTSKINVLKQELAYLEARFKVGQLSSNTYLHKSKGPKQKLEVLEKASSELQTLIDSKSSAEIVIPEGGLKVLGFDFGLSKKQSPEQAKPAVTEVTETEQMSPSANVQQESPAPPPPPPPITVSTTGLQIMPERVTEGSSVGIIVMVTNVTQENVQQDVELKVNGEVKDSRQVSLLPGESQEITFVQVMGKPGDYKVDINGLTGGFSVIPVETIRSLR